MKFDSQKINELLTRGVEEVIVKDSLKKKLESGKQLRIKFGIDPTGSDLHIGHAVPLRKLRQFQDSGHKVILLIGDYTARIGDPSGRNETRPMLSRKEVEANMKTYIKQASKVLDMKTVEIRHNSEWFEDKGWAFVMDLTSRITVSRLLDRDDFKKRLAEGSDIQAQELMYPLMQGYDSVELKCDVEIGGTDQKFNLLVGRKLQRAYGQPEQDIMTLPILEGTDGERKMSKTYDNYIAILDTPEEMYGKTMSVPDSLIIKYFELATNVPLDQVKQYERELKKGTNPRDIKMRLAYALTRLYHGEQGAKKGEVHFVHTFSKKETPDDMPSVKPTHYDIVTVLVEGKLVASKSEARRAIEQGGVRVNDKVVSSFEHHAKKDDVVQKGKRFFVKIA